jgi:hypothetical protein
MTKRRSRQAAASRGADGTCRERLRTRGGRRPAWVRPLRRAQRAINASILLLASTLRAVERSERCAHRRPVQTSRNLQGASGQLQVALARLNRAAREIAETNQCMILEPERAAGAPPLVAEAALRWVDVAGSLAALADDVFTLHEDVLSGLETGTLIPEPSAWRRPRIVIAPRPQPIRAFLLRRQPRVIDRIASILRRRRRTPRPASLRVPRRSILGRAPPLSSICAR